MGSSSFEGSSALDPALQSESGNDESSPDPKGKVSTVHEYFQTFGFPDESDDSSSTVSSSDGRVATPASGAPPSRGVCIPTGGVAVDHSSQDHQYRCLVNMTRSDRLEFDKFRGSLSSDVARSCGGCCGFSSDFGEATELSKAYVSREDLSGVCGRLPPVGQQREESTYVGTYLRLNPVQDVEVEAFGAVSHIKLFDLPKSNSMLGLPHAAVMLIMTGLMTSHSVSCCGTSGDAGFDVLEITWGNPYESGSVSSSFAIRSGVLHPRHDYCLLACKNSSCEVQSVGLMEVVSRPAEFGLSALTVARIQNFLGSSDIAEAFRVARESFSRLVNAKPVKFYSLNKDDTVLSTLCRSSFIRVAKTVRSIGPPSVMADGDCYIAKLDHSRQFVRVVDFQFAEALAVLSSTGFFHDQTKLVPVGLAPYQAFDRLVSDGMITVMATY